MVTNVLSCFMKPALSLSLPP